MPKKTKDPISTFADFAAGFPAPDVPMQVISKSAELFLDTLGCIYGGSGAAGVEESLEVFDLWGGKEQATVYGLGTRVSAPAAAFVNSVAAHARDFDDTHDAAVNHGCVTVVPAMLAAVQALAQLKPSGKEFLASLAVALDISNRISLSIIRQLHVGWLPTTITGPFAAACGVGRLLRLNTEQMRHAFGFAYAQVHGNRQALADGALAKRMQPAFSAVAGLQSALFAAKGLTAAENIISGEFGLPVLYNGGNIDLSRLTDDLGERWETENISIKPYPSCRCTHPVIDAALELREEMTASGIDPKTALESGSIYLPPPSYGQIGRDFTIRGNPTVDAQFNAQYTAALTFIHGKPRLADFEAERIVEREEISALAGRFRSVEFDRENSGLSPIEMEIRLTGGKTLKRRIEYPTGSPEKPISGEALMEKFRDNLSYSANPLAEKEGKEIVKALEELPEAADVTSLLERL